MQQEQLAPGQPINFALPQDQSYLSKNYNEFEEWYLTAQAAPTSLSIPGNGTPQYINNDTLPIFNNETNSSLILFNKNTAQNNLYKPILDVGRAIFDGIDSILIQNGVLGEVALKGCGKNEIRFRDCIIKHLIIDKTIGNGHITASIVVIEGCEIGTLDIREASIDFMRIIGGTVRRLLVLPDKSPFTGLYNANYHSLFPTNPACSKLLNGAQPYRNMRKHADALDDTRTSMFFRLLELETDRHSERGLVRVVSEFNRLLSDYGRTPSRPLFAAVGVYIFVTVLLFSLIETVATGSLPDAWKPYFSGDELNPIFWRSAWAAFQAINRNTSTTPGTSDAAAGGDEIWERWDGMGDGGAEPGAEVVPE